MAKHEITKRLASEKKSNSGLSLEYQTPTFHFKKLTCEDRCEPEAEVSRVDEPSLFMNNVVEYAMSDFEKLCLLKYQIKDFDDGLQTKFRMFSELYKRYLLMLKNIPFEFESCNMRYHGPRIETFEKKIDQMPKIHKYCQFGGDGDILSWHEFLQDKDFSAVVDEYINDLVGYYKKEIARLESKKNIKKEQYSRNLETYLNIIGEKDEKTIEVIRYLYYQSVSGIYASLRGDNYSEKNILKFCGITEKELDKIMLSDSFNLLAGVTKDRSHSRTQFGIRPNIASLIFGVKGGEQDFIRTIMKQVEPTKLTLDDFSHIKQRDYIKDILSNALKNKTEGVNILIYGRAGTGKTEFAKALIKEIGAKGYEVGNDEKGREIYNRTLGIESINNGLGEKEQNLQRNGVFGTLNLCLKNANNSVIFYDEAEDFFRKSKNTDQSKQIINATLEKNKTPVIWTCNELGPDWIERSFIRRFTYAIEFDKLNEKVLIGLTDKIGKKNGVEVGEKIKQLIRQEKPSIGIIEKCIKAYKLSGVNDSECLYAGLKDLIYAERYAWGKPKDINRNQEHDYNQKLANTDIELETITNGIIKSGKNDWSLILYGVSGTGKTAYAEFLGKKLGMRVIKKKVSDLQSPFVGVCEQNIDEAFEQARSENGILLFDEGDVWLRDRRRNVNSWETSQTNQFLQNLEAATTPVIVTTNLMDSLDQAALRRFVFKVGFKYMTKPQVKEAFKTFYDIEATDEDSNISYATPGDFAVIQKQLDYMGEKPTAPMIKKLLLEEIKNKKDDFKENSMKI